MERPAAGPRRWRASPPLLQIGLRGCANSPISLSQVQFARTPLDVLINPLRSREYAAHNVSLPDVSRVVIDLQQALERFSRGK